MDRLHIEEEIKNKILPGQSPFDRPDVVVQTLENHLLNSVLQNLQLYFKYTLLRNMEFSGSRYPLYFSRVINLFMDDMQPSHKNILLFRNLYYEDSDENSSTGTSVDEDSD